LEIVNNLTFWRVPWKREFGRWSLQASGGEIFPLRGLRAFLPLIEVLALMGFFL
jgi:hypothetical protein